MDVKIDMAPKSWAMSFVKIIYSNRDPVQVPCEGAKYIDVESEIRPEGQNMIQR